LPLNAILFYYYHSFTLNKLPADNRREDEERKQISDVVSNYDLSLIHVNEDYTLSQIFKVSSTPFLKLTLQAFLFAVSMFWFTAIGVPTLLYMADRSERHDDFEGMFIGRSLLFKVGITLSL
jgi:hypothetical protein